MVKQLRKTRIRKTFNYDKNRKNQKKKMKSTGNILCKEIKKEYDSHKTLARNIRDMGLVYDVNRSLGLPNNKQDRVKLVKKLDNGFVEEDVSDTERGPSQVKKVNPKKHVAENLEKDARALRESKFELPKGQVQWISYLMDTYGLNYKLMAKDKKNYYQETWRQLRAKCRKLMSIPKQFAKYLEERNLLEDDIDPKDPRWQEVETDLDDD
jgi:hypothetical protein